MPFWENPSEVFQKHFTQPIPKFGMSGKAVSNWLSNKKKKNRKITVYDISQSPKKFTVVVA